MARIIVVVSGKGGVGKTTSSINIASALTSFGRSAILIDGDLSSPNVGMHLGTHQVPITLNDVLLGRKHIKEAVYVHNSGVKVVFAGISYDSVKNTGLENFKKSIDGLRDTNEIVIIDGPPGNGASATAVISAADEVIIVTNPEMPAVTDALRTIKLSEDLSKNVIGVVIARVKKSDTEMIDHNISTLLNKPILAIIPEDESLKEALILKHPVVFSHPDSNASIHYKKLAARLLNQEYEHKIKGPREGVAVFNSIFKKMSLK